ncbi:MAG: acylphosphatase [Planctomycetes bacterium]|nr:acylphosphatase [Planctomycetota bacterium]
MGFSLSFLRFFLYNLLIDYCSGVILMADVAKHVVYTGRVQGVGFRFTAQRIALRYELAGYVKNLPTSQVEMFVQGHLDDVVDCLGDISESFAAYIRDTKINEVPANPSYTQFTIAF